MKEIEEARKLVPKSVAPEELSKFVAWEKSFKGEC